MYTKKVVLVRTNSTFLGFKEKMLLNNSQDVLHVEDKKLLTISLD
jgi:hypothetical protein